MPKRRIAVETASNNVEFRWRIVVGISMTDRFTLSEMRRIRDLLNHKISKEEKRKEDAA